MTTTAKSQINADDLINLLGSSDQAKTTTPITPENLTSLFSTTKEAQPESYFGNLIGDVVPKVFNLKRELGEKTAGLVDAALSIVPQSIKSATYASARASQKPEEKAKQLSEQFSSYFQPKIGQALGVTESPNYQKPLGLTVSNITSDIGETIKNFAKNYGLTPTQISATLQKKGVNIPASDIENMLSTVGLLAPELAGSSYTGVKNQLKSAGKEIKQTLPQFEFQNVKKSQMTPSGVSMGAMSTAPERTIEAMAENASPELKAKIQEIGHENIDHTALQTKLLEEKHGVTLSTGQRSGKIQDYAEQWNNRGAHPTTLGALFENQPKQIADALEKQMDIHGENINDRSPEGIGSKEIKGLSDVNDKLNSQIGEAYDNLHKNWTQLREQKGLSVVGNKLEDDFPVDGNAFLGNAQTVLKNNGLQYDVPNSIKMLMKDIENNNGHMTYGEFVNFDKRLSAASKEGTGSERQAAFAIRQELNNIPLQGEAKVLEPMRDKAVGLAKQRFDLIKTIPAFRDAIGEASDIKTAGGDVTSLKADKFHAKHVTNASPEAVRRMLQLVGEDSEAHQAMKVGELQNLKENAGFRGNSINFNPTSLNKQIFKQDEKHKLLFGPEGKENLNEINFLGNKIIQPKSGTFNSANTLSGYLQQMAGLGAETGTAFLTNGWSTPAIGFIKRGLEARKEAQFGAKSIDPFEGIQK